MDSTHGLAERYYQIPSTKWPERWSGWEMKWNTIHKMVWRMIMAWGIVWLRDAIYGLAEITDIAFKLNYRCGSWMTGIISRSHNMVNVIYRWYYREESSQGATLHERNVQLALSEDLISWCHASWVQKLRVALLWYVTWWHVWYYLEIPHQDYECNPQESLLKWKSSWGAMPYKWNLRVTLLGEITSRCNASRGTYGWHYSEMWFSADQTWSLFVWIKVDLCECCFQNF